MANKEILRREKTVSAVAQSLMRGRCKEFDPYEATERQKKKYDQVLEYHKAYLERISASSEELDEVIVEKSELNRMNLRIEYLENMVNKRDSEIDRVTDLNNEFFD